MAVGQIAVSHPRAATNALHSAKVPNLLPCFNMLPLVSNAVSNTDLQYLLSRGFIHFVPWQLSHEASVVNGAVPCPETHLYAVGALPSFHCGPNFAA